TGLKNGNYKLTIDGREIGLYNDAQLAEGINLATLATPMSEQAMSVYNLITQHNDLHNARWRTVQVPLEPLHLSPTQSTMDALDTLDNAVAEQAHKAAQPKPHSFSLAAVN
ncbi:MAG: GDSL family lipase, partial [Rhodospirillales bacterium]|nr:GDSL family lipase [Acetobacter sp.]